MATIEANEVEAQKIGFAVREAMLDDVLPIVQERPAAIVGDRLPVGLGWLRDLPDFRDYTADSAKIQPQLDAIGIAQPEDLAVPARVDLRAYCSPVEDQGAIGSCTANAVVGLVEYFERRAYGRHIDASRLFLYKATRDLLHWTGDTGAYLRSTMGALALFGVPPEEYWPYKIATFDTEPSAFCFAFAHDYRAISYFRLDDGNTSPSALVTKIKAGLAGGVPCVFGFTVYSSIAQAARTGRIPYPAAGEKVLGGHAMMVVGYDDNITITNSNNHGSAKGALLVRNSWGPSWGDHGYGALPYEYVGKQLAVDFWSLTKQVWTDTGQFKA
jgi:C1A family cysteine protease